ncbi:MAG: hypothetical protein WKG07_42535 [Hymenobacter sp.]
MSLLDSALASSSANQGRYLAHHRPRPGAAGLWATPALCPTAPCTRAADGQRPILAVGTDAQFQQLCMVLMRPHWAAEAPLCHQPGAGAPPRRPRRIIADAHRGS